MELSLFTAFCLLGLSHLTSAGESSEEFYTVVSSTYAAECESTSCHGVDWQPWTVTETDYSTATATVDETFSVTQTDFVTETVATTAPITVTYTVTTSLDITLCETRVVNPTYTAPTPQASDSTFGCPPGYVCIPPQAGCNFERGLPDENYYCEPSQCIPAPALLNQIPWGDPITNNESPLTNASLRFDITAGYFNVNPLAFNLPYNIFYEEIVRVYTTTVYPPGAAPTGRRKDRQAQTFIPAVCFDTCNDAMLEAQTGGKTPALCRSDSAFVITMNYCEQCIIYHKAEDTSDFVVIQPQFQQFINYCAEHSISILPPTSTATIVILTSSAIGPSSVVPVATTETIPSSTPTQPPAPVVTATQTLTGATASSVASSYGLPSPSTLSNPATAPQISTASISLSLSPPSPVISMSPTEMTMTMSSTIAGGTVMTTYMTTIATSVPVTVEPVGTSVTGSIIGSYTGSGTSPPQATYTGSAESNFKTRSAAALWLPLAGLGVVLLGNVLYL